MSFGLSSWCTKKIGLRLSHENEFIPLVYYYSEIKKNLFSLFFFLNKKKILL